MPCRRACRSLRRRSTNRLPVNIGESAKPMKSYAALTGALLARQGEAAPSRPAAPMMELDLSRLFVREARPAIEGDLPAWWTREIAQTEGQRSPASHRVQVVEKPAIETSEELRLENPATDAKIPRARPGHAKPKPSTDRAVPPVTMTLRLDKDRHLRLKIAAAKTRRSSAELIRASLDRHLHELASASPEACACLAMARSSKD